jgi:hypothetical protein
MLKIPAQNGTKFSQTKYLKIILLLRCVYIFKNILFKTLKIYIFLVVLDANIYYYLHIKTRITSINFFFIKSAFFMYMMILLLLFLYNDVLILLKILFLYYTFLLLFLI